MIATQTEEVEITAEERLEKLTELRKRRYELSEKPLDQDTFYEWVDLQTAYDNAALSQTPPPLGAGLERRNETKQQKNRF